MSINSTKAWSTSKEYISPSSEWSQEQTFILVILRALWNDSYESIGEKIGKTKNACMGRMDRINKEGLEPVEIFYEMINREENRKLLKWPIRLSKVWSWQEIFALFRWYALWYTYKSIGKKIGKTTNACMGRMDRIRNENPELLEEICQMIRGGEKEVLICLKLFVLEQPNKRGNINQSRTEFSKRLMGLLFPDTDTSESDSQTNKEFSQEKASINGVTLAGPVPLPYTSWQTSRTISDNIPEDEWCQWPIWNPGTDEFRFCGEERKSWGPYCSEHHGKSRVSRR